MDAYTHDSTDQLRFLSRVLTMRETFQLPLRVWAMPPGGQKDLGFLPKKPLF